MSLTADTIANAQIRALRDRYGEGSRLWDPTIVHECDIAIGDVTFDDIGQIQRLRQARGRCAAILNERSTKEKR